MILDQTLSCSAVGSPETVLRDINAVIDRTKADELIITTPLHDPAKRLQSFTLLADIVRRL